jgi:hypothetical protein
MTTPSDTKQRAPLDFAVSVISIAGLAAALLVIYGDLDSWAALNFADPILASLLVGVIELALFLFAIALTPFLSGILQKLARRITSPRQERFNPHNS